jgi:hypothetical protein
MGGPEEEGREEVYVVTEGVCLYQKEIERTRGTEEEGREVFVCMWYHTK